MCFSSRRLLGERPRQHELGLENCPGALDHAVQSGGQKPDHRMLHPSLDRRDNLPGVALVPMPVERFGRDAELDDEIARKVLRLGLAAFLPPEAQEGDLVSTHDNPGIRAADKASLLSESFILCENALIDFSSSLHSISTEIVDIEREFSCQQKLLKNVTGPVSSRPGFLRNYSVTACSSCRPRAFNRRRFEKERRQVSGSRHRAGSSRLDPARTELRELRTPELQLCAKRDRGLRPNKRSAVPALANLACIEARLRRGRGDRNLAYVDARGIRQRRRPALPWVGVCGSSLNKPASLPIPSRASITGQMPSNRRWTLYNGHSRQLA